VALLASRGALGQDEAPQVPPGWSDPLRQERPADLPTDAELEQQGALVGTIEFDAHDVFDPDNPKEHNWFFRAANTLHIVTREQVLRRLLLFREGDAYSARALAESERVLREAGYLFDACVLPVGYEDGRVRVRVVTRDVWTLQVGVSVGRSGGENSTSFGVADSNLLGLGKEVTLERSEDVDRTSVLYRYRDPNIAGTRWRLELGYQDNSDGFQRQFVLDRPFFSLSTRWSAGAGLLNFDRVDSLYTLGEIRDQFRHIEEHYGIGFGFSRGLRHGATRRWSAGLSRESDRFDVAPGFAPSPEQPEDRLLVYPWVGFAHVSDEYERLRNLDRIERTEDLNFGFEGAVQLGYSSRSFGADRDQAILSLTGQTGFNPKRGTAVFVSGHASGRFGHTGHENVLAGLATRYDVRVFGRHDFHVRAAVDVANDLDGEDQLLLGGDNGLRGYPLRYQEGDRRYLVTLEQRFYTPWQILRLFNLGGAIFADAGVAWFAGPRGDASELGLLRDVGFGLRVASARSKRGSMVHLDVAFPLDGDETIERVQFLVTAKESF